MKSDWFVPIVDNWIYMILGQMTADQDKNLYSIFLLS